MSDEENDSEYERVSDRETSGIIRDIAIAAHEYSKSRTTILTSLKKTKDQATSAQTKRPQGYPEYSGPRGAKAYPTRLFGGIAPHPGYVSAFAKDYARIVHSPAFRKLQGKTQLIPAGENYFFRTRLSHSIEVAEIAARIAHKINTSKALGKYHVDYDLVTSAALLHDIGHPPFGHSGEEALNERMAAHNLAFEGNAQTLRLVTRLENRLGRLNAVQDVYNEPRGLNLAVGTLASILKYDVEWSGPHFRPNGMPAISKAYYPEEAETVRLLKERLQVSGRLYTVECQIMDLADDIAYSAYDLEDAMEGSIISPFDLISVDDDTLTRITADAAAQLKKREQDSTLTPRDVLRELASVFGTILEFAHPDNYNLKSWNDRVVFVGRAHNEATLHAKNPLIEGSSWKRSLKVISAASPWK
jgi:dGTPase